MSIIKTNLLRKLENSHIIIFNSTNINFMKLLAKPYIILTIFCLYLGIWRIPSLFDKLWYLDENIYMSVGYGMAKGQLLYDGVWDNKPPLIYLIYALSYLVGGVQIQLTRILGMLLGWSMIIGVYKYIKDIFGYSNKIGYFGAFLMMILLTYGWETYIFNGEILFEPFILWGSYFLFSKTLVNNKNLITGVLFSLAAFTKIHAIIIILVLLTVWYALELFKSSKLSNNRFYDCLKIFGIITIPYFTLYTCYLFLGKLDILNYSLFGFGKNYISYSHPVFFGYEIDWLSGNIYRGFLLLISLFTTIYLYYKSSIQKPTLIAISWVLVATYVAFLSQRAYPHYLISIFTPFVLLVSVYVSKIKSDIPISQKITSLVSFILFLQIILLSFNQGKPIDHYGGYQEYLKRKDTILSGNFIKNDEYHRSFNTWQYKKTDTIKDLVLQYSEPEDYIYIVSNTSEVYPLTGRKTAYRQVTDFQYDQPIQKVVEDLFLQKPSVIILDSESTSYHDFVVELKKYYSLKEVREGRYEAWTHSSL
jgi:hypothetical protein